MNRADWLKGQETKARIFWEIIEERERQDLKWGGPDHDDQHQGADWARYIEEQTTWQTPSEFRRQMIRVAALALAAIESHDRESKV